MRISKPKRPFPTQERLHELLERHYDENGTLYFVALHNRGKVKKGQKLYGYEAVCNKGFPSVHKRMFLGVDGHVMQICVWNYIFEYGDYQRKGNVVDHIDNIASNNHHENLRILTRSQNSQRKKRSADKFSQYRGVTWNINAKLWEARIQNKGKVVYIGCFKSEKLAAQAYDVFAMKYRGLLADLNFPELQAD